MSIFARYMARRFFLPFVFGLGLFSLLIFLGDMFDKMNRLVQSKASIGVILAYLWLEVPYWTVRVMPMATLLATLIAMTGFVQSGEWIAVQASGFRTRSFWRPVLLCALAVTAMAFAAQETVLPWCRHRALQLWRDRIYPQWESDRFNDVALMGAPNEFIYALLFVPKLGVMDRPVLERVGPKGVEYQLDAKRAEWDEARKVWVFQNGFERTFVEGGRVASQKSFEEIDSGLTVPPRSLMPRQRDPDEMSLRELRDYAESVQRLGIPKRVFQLAAANKISYPFTNFIMAALGIPIALRLRRAPRVASFFLALGVSFLYLWVMEVGRSLGLNGGVPPYVGAWTANVVFGSVAVFLIRRYDD